MWGGTASSVWEEGAGQTAEVSTDTTGLLIPGGYASRSTTLHLGQNWGRAAVAVLRDVAR